MPPHLEAGSAADDDEWEVVPAMVPDEAGSPWANPEDDARDAAAMAAALPPTAPQRPDGDDEMLLFAAAAAPPTAAADANDAPDAPPCFLDVDWDASWDALVTPVTHFAASLSSRLAPWAKSLRRSIHDLVEALPPPDADVVVLKRDAALMVLGVVGCAAIGAACHARHLSVQVRARDAQIERLVAEVWRERCETNRSNLVC